MQKQKRRSRRRHPEHGKPRHIFRRRLRGLFRRVLCNVRPLMPSAFDKFCIYLLFQQVFTQKAHKNYMQQIF